MAKVNEKEVERTGFFSSPRRVLYTVGFALVFGIAASALGIVSYEFQRYGNTYEHYPAMEYKHDLGLILFSCIYTFLFLIGHPFISMGISIFFTFIGAVFWGTSAGILFAVTPFRSYTCGNPVESFASNWQPYVGQCSRIVALQGLCWAEWGVLVFLLFGSIGHKFEFRSRPNATYYGA
ncbi:proteophosphoglycan 5 [Moniliophthora roreri MCA 2997]|uniref:Proteophosphoglycan 5 n=2 Tax=Moniliophthora roreri TaxID=221103 RepID=V2WUC3_MONRO|nr:proteophosphoglycan 5 [Moniliophthora roreri MCA 2997]